MDIWASAQGHSTAPPYQQWVESDLFAVEVQTHITRCGHVFANYVTRVTPKGQRYFLNGKFTI